MYRDIIKSKVENIQDEKIRESVFSEYKTKSAPTQASSNFITNKEQGDWAERLLYNAIDQTLNNFVVVKYGKSDNLIAGDDRFSDFYEEYQNELVEIGKRPDLLIFKKEDYDSELGRDISSYPHDQIDEYISKAVAGLEVRSSAFLVEKYEEYNRKDKSNLFDEILSLKNVIKDSVDWDKQKSQTAITYINFLNSMNEDNIADIPRRPISQSIDSNVKENMKKLKDKINKFIKRDTLSITPKLEDLQVVYRWIQKYNVPHFYVQVFFDRIYGISFEEILDVLGKDSLEYSVEKDTKNQGKTTIKININNTSFLSEKVFEPEYIAKRKELSKGRLLFYTEFKNECAILKKAEIMSLLKIEDEE